MSEGREEEARRLRRKYRALDAAASAMVGIILYQLSLPETVADQAPSEADAETLYRYLRGD